MKTLKKKYSNGPWLINKYQQLGFTLTEIMVALTISLILMAGVLTIMSTSKRTYSLQSEMAQLQENARFILDDITYSVRLAGYFGASSKPIPGMALPLDGKDNETIANAPTAFPKSDILIVSFFDPGSKLKLRNIDEELINKSPFDSKVTQTISNMKTAVKKEFSLGETKVLLAKDSTVPAKGSNVIISDFAGSGVYQVTNISTTSPPVLTITPGLRRSHQWPVEIFSTAVPIRYEVSGFDKNGNGKIKEPIDGFVLSKTLRDENGQYNLLPFIEGVQNMQVRYGVESSSGINYRDNPISSAQVLRVTLLMRTPNRRNDIPDAENKDFFLDKNLKAYNPSVGNVKRYEEGYRHRLFTTTIRVRN